MQKGEDIYRDLSPNMLFKEATFSSYTLTCSKNIINAQNLLCSCLKMAFILFTLVEVNSFAWRESPAGMFEVIKIIILSLWVNKAVKLSNIKI